MRIHALFVVSSIAAVAVLTEGQKVSYADNPNNYNCEDEMIEFVNPVADNIKTREIKSSYVYYNTPQDTYPTKYTVRYSSPKKYYPSIKRESRFYQVFQPTGERSLDCVSKTTSGQSKPPAIQIYVV